MKRLAPLLLLVTSLASLAGCCGPCRGWHAFRPKYFGGCPTGACGVGSPMPPGSGGPMPPGASYYGYDTIQTGTPVVAPPVAGAAPLYYETQYAPRTAVGPTESLPTY